MQLAREKKEMDLQINRLMTSTKGFFCAFTKAFLKVQTGFRNFQIIKENLLTSELSDKDSPY